MCAEKKERNTSRFTKFWGVYYWTQRHKDVITILFLGLGIIGAIYAAFFGAFLQAQYSYNQELQKSKMHEANVAKLLYIDIRNQQYFLNNVNNCFQNENLSNPCIFIGKVYPDNGIYFAYQDEIASLKYPIAKNITQFYSDLIWADFTDQEFLIGIQNNQSAYAYDRQKQIKILIGDAQKLCPIIQKELEDEYNITPDSSITIYQ